MRTNHSRRFRPTVEGLDDRIVPSAGPLRHHHHAPAAHHHQRPSQGVPAHVNRVIPPSVFPHRVPPFPIQNQGGQAFISGPGVLQDYSEFPSLDLMNNDNFDPALVGVVDPPLDTGSGDFSPPPDTGSGDFSPPPDTGSGDFGCDC
jgi:hypothetical protein